ncbi:uncharacterized protein LOC112572366 isoform X2 [Pomacea canaliculata]|uniref:uncharacterized protein LOC112572366 isoform X2 n=1 Tax=Pomacea canaliculata TaxID=400727 RepID=UPI000D7273AC|nr:uncharacterized protein LOC112572366 isoform X2 [Pomacea canaliculata]
MFSSAIKPWEFVYETHESCLCVEGEAGAGCVERGSLLPREGEWPQGEGRCGIFTPAAGDASGLTLDKDPPQEVTITSKPLTSKRLLETLQQRGGSQGKEEMVATLCTGEAAARS